MASHLKLEAVLTTTLTTDPHEMTSTNTNTSAPPTRGASPPINNVETTLPMPGGDSSSVAPPLSHSTHDTPLKPFDDAGPDDGTKTPTKQDPHPLPTDASITPATTSPSAAIRDDSATHPPLPSNSTSQQIEETPVREVHPRIAALQSMFPTFDEVVLQSVLESVNWDQDQAIDTLLGMSDPEYKPEARPNQPPPPSQTELDEQFARQLMLQDQQAQQAAWQSAHPVPPGGGRRHSGLQQQPQSQSAPAGDGGGQIAADLQEQFTRVAEVGKRTFGNIFSKVKAKIQEFDNPRPNQPSSTQPTWGAPSNPPGSSYPQQEYGQNANYNYTPAPPQRSAAISPAQQPAYYDPNPPRSPSPSPQPSPVPAASQPPAAIANAAASSTQPTPLTGLEAPRAGSFGAGATPIDGNKLGLLPKRPVSLLRPSDGATPMQRKESEDDELEYVENPFEDGNRK
ncbi:hypothetical protein EYR38_006346 [Pleurotus pulmonarius]|nr:hypothetical protein EYR38_006346 [Pleurotus pulmonarius]